MRKDKGFTLVELVIVIGILGVLAAVAVTIINPAKFFAQSRDARRESDLKVIQNALEMYYSDPAHNAYPATTGWEASLEPDYIRDVPQDPRGGSYCYEKVEAGYKLCANKEQGGVVSQNCGGRGFNFCVENPY